MIKIDVVPPKPKIVDAKKEMAKADLVKATNIQQQIDILKDYLGLK